MAALSRPHPCVYAQFIPGGEFELQLRHFAKRQTAPGKEASIELDYYGKRLLRTAYRQRGAGFDDWLQSERRVAATRPEDASPRLPIAGH